MRHPLVQGIITALTALALTLILVAPVRAGSPPSLVKDINPSGASNPSGLIAVHNTLFFAANDGVHGRELWKSDGTKAGTRMVKDIRAYGRSSSPSNLINVNGTLFFTANDGNHKNQVWKSDGTRAGTVRVTNIINGAYPGDAPFGLRMPVPPVAVGSRLFFFNEPCCVASADLYVTDGTEAGTRMVAELSQRPGDGASLAFKGKLYFVNLGGSSNAAFDEHQLWVSDGTVNGTHRVKGTPGAYEMNILPASGQNLYFATYDEVDWTVQVRLWRTDGTAGGIKPLTSVGELGAVPTEATYMAKRLYFASDDQLWKTNGTAAGTTPFSPGDVSFLTTAGGRIFFKRGGHVWISDGTSMGTQDVAEFEGPWPRDLIAVGGKICFSVPDWEANAWALWVSDGTQAGTYPDREFTNVAAIEEGVSQAALGGTLFVGADDGIHGMELWSYTP